MRRFEELSMNAWPSLQTMLYDGWVIRFANGYTKRANSVNDINKSTLRAMLLSIIPRKYFASISSDGRTFACGLGVLEDGYMGLFDIIVDKNLRRQGYGEKLVRGLLSRGRQDGAEYSYLQVISDNYPAISLYSKIGYKSIYKYWYRVK